jgi:hypothetical protein
MDKSNMIEISDKKSIAFLGEEIVQQLARASPSAKMLNSMMIKPTKEKNDAKIKVKNCTLFA